LPDLKSQLLQLIEKSLRDVPESSSLSLPLSLEIPPDKKYGDYSCNIALRLASLLKKDPWDIASHIRDTLGIALQSSPLERRIKAIQIVKPGFINFYLDSLAMGDVLEEILAQGKDYGKSSLGKGQKIQIEFVSANPTGPLSVAHGRQAAVGDALGNILSLLGYKVQKEYYVNDEGNQIDLLGHSIALRAREILGEAISFPEEGYQGDYVREIAKTFLDRRRIEKLSQLNQIKDSTIYRQFGVDYLLDVIKKELEAFGVRFDSWSHQSKIATPQTIEEILKSLRQKGRLYDHEGAVWFQSSALGDDKDRVVKKNDGSFTYLTADIVYHKNKFERGFTRLIDIWGPDHHGYIPRLKAAVQALGYDPEALKILIVQLATIFREGKPLSMSTRRGQYIRLKEVMEEVGKDAGRFFFLMRRIKAHLEFDLELAKKQSPENPVYYIQYAHARIHSILKLAKESRLSLKKSGFDSLKEEEELGLIKKLGQFPELLIICHNQLDPFLLTSHLQEVATLFHKFYDRHRVVDELKPDLSRERLALIEATRVVLINGLTLLGLSAPEKM